MSTVARGILEIQEREKNGIQSEILTKTKIIVVKWTWRRWKARQLLCDELVQHSELGQAHRALISYQSVQRERQQRRRSLCTVTAKDVVTSQNAIYRTECGLWFIHAGASSGSCGPDGLFICGGTRRGLGESRWLPAGGTGWTIQRCAGTFQGAEVAGVAFSSWGVFSPSLCNDRCQGRVQAERESLFMRQSTVAFERISCISSSRCSHFEMWRMSSWLRICQSHVLCLGVACGILKNEFFGRFSGYSRAMLGLTVDACSAPARAHTISTSTWTPILRCFSSFSRRMERSAQSRCLRCLEIRNSMHGLHVAGRLHEGWVGGMSSSHR